MIKQQNNLIKPLVLLLPVAISASLAFYFSFTESLKYALSINSQAGIEDPMQNLVMSILITSAFAYIFMLASFIGSGLISWFIMIKLHIVKAGKISLISTLIILTMYYLLIFKGLFGIDNTFWLTVVIFVVIYEFCAIIILLRDNKALLD